MRQVAASSQSIRLPKFDGRTRKARLIRQFRSGLTAQLGGEPSFIQSLLIDRAAWLLWHVSELDTRTISIHEMPDREIRTYLAWSNTLTRCLGQLGVGAANGAT